MVIWQLKANETTKAQWCIFVLKDNDELFTRLGVVDLSRILITNVVINIGSRYAFNVKLTFRKRNTLNISDGPTTPVGRAAAVGASCAHRCGRMLQPTPAAARPGGAWMARGVGIRRGSVADGSLQRRPRQPPTTPRCTSGQYL